MGMTRTRSPGSLLLRTQVEGGAGRERCTQGMRETLTIKEEGEEEVERGTRKRMNSDQEIDGQEN